ncbi:unnamed protein product [Trifolium pratense]|uniref:Uncharacterized protein n=1 Tax=Trifolium pratense TaxID=57577 RepID=A0ACB0LIU4_TRIPR|nr:unnamed protein product [Trifolium pratense]
MSDTEEMTGSQAAAKHKLVDTITDPALDWVAPEPRGIASTLTAEDPRLYTIVEDVGNGPVNWEAHLPEEGKRICSTFSEDGFAMYELAFKELGFKLPFSNFECEVFGRLKVAPSQLHPNSMAFIRAYPILCRYLDVEATVPLFFHIFKIQKQIVGERQGWVSLKHASAKIFKMFVESARGFKERYYVVKPVTQAARDSLYMDKELLQEDGSPRLNEQGVPMTERVPRFPLAWSSEHFEMRTEEYLTAAVDLSPEEQAGFLKLKTYVKGFKPCTFTVASGAVALDKKGRPRVEPRFVNTKALLACKSVEEEKVLLDNMADLASELFKLAAEHKGDKPKKKTKRAKVGSSSTMNLEETASGSPSQSSPVVSSKVAPGSRTKRQRDEVMATIVDLSEGDGGFVLPACLSNRSFFDNHPLQVPVSERNHVLGTSAAARQEQLTQDVAAVIRLAETALVLNEGGPTYEAEKLAAKNRKLEAEITLLENDLLDLRSKQENYFKNMEEARLTAEQLEKTNKVLEDLKVSSAEQRSKMLEEMAMLQAKCAPLEDEKEETLKFVTRGDLVKEIRRLGGLMLASMVHGWKNAIAQLKIVNVEHGLITEGIHKLKKVENGQIVIPEKYREMALEEEKDEEEEDDDDDEEEDAEEEAVEEEKNPDGDKEGHDESH